MTTASETTNATNDYADLAGDPVASTPAPAAEAPTEQAAADQPAEAEPEKWQHDPSWKYNWIDFHGDKLAVRIPNSAALTALFQAGQTCTPEFQLMLTSKFVQRHISRQSIERVLDRMSDPDDAEEFQTVEVWNELLKILAEKGGERAVKDAEALAEVQNGKT